MYGNGFVLKGIKTSRRMIKNIDSNMKQQNLITGNN